MAAAKTVAKETTGRALSVSPSTTSRRSSRRSAAPAPPLGWGPHL